MNERIKELAEQAGWSGFEALDERNQKFAELIVRECAWVCEHRYSHNHKDLSEGAFAAIACSDAILEHFGVEE